MGKKAYKELVRHCEARMATMANGSGNGSAGSRGAPGSPGGHPTRGQRKLLPLVVAPHPADPH